ncbi:472_t:CDS:1 [Diversispora eburnea]|uniref:472_t:CDS:1 n=1 Tax=Diversispora eburnea TaxID=1213867 RepID=A0A9N9AEZ5_9GLOM|nr:472_t:CDS:1 [Diversispora eburnea]
MSHFVTSPLSNLNSNVSTLINTQITLDLPLTPNSFISKSPTLKKSRVIENNNDNITSFGENNAKKFEEDCYPKVNAIHYQGKHTYYYQYNILDLGNYLTNVRRTQRSKFRIPNGYRVQVLIYELDVICQTNYEFNER